MESRGGSGMQCWRKSWGGARQSRRHQARPFRSLQCRASKCATVGRAGLGAQRAKASIRPLCLRVWSENKKKLMILSGNRKQPRVESSRLRPRARDIRSLVLDTRLYLGRYTTTLTTTGQRQAVDSPAAEARRLSRAPGSPARPGTALVLRRASSSMTAPTGRAAAKSARRHSSGCSARGGQSIYCGLPAARVRPSLVRSWLARALGRFGRDIRIHARNPSRLHPFWLSIVARSILSQDQGPGQAASALVPDNVPNRRDEAG